MWPLTQPAMFLPISPALTVTECMQMAMLIAACARRDCDAERRSNRPAAKEIELSTSADPAGPVDCRVSRQVVSYGAGTNSTAMVCEMVRRGEAVCSGGFADTGGERPETYAHLLGSASG